MGAAISDGVIGIALRASRRRMARSPVTDHWRAD
jgi:hypothetical protein